MPVGLDIGHRRIKLAVVSGTAKAPKVTLFAERRIAFADDEAQQYRNKVEAIQALLAEHRLRHQPVYINVDSADCMIRVITLPFTQADQIEKVIRFEAENHLHGVTIDDVLLDYHILETLENTSRVLIVAVPKKVIRQLLQLTQDAGLEAPAIGLDCFSLFNALQLAGYARPDEANLFLDLGADGCKVMLIENGTLKLVRSAKVGTFSGTRSVAKTRRMTPDALEDESEGRAPAAATAVAIADDAPGGDPADIAEIQKQYLAKVAAEITRTALRINLATPIRAVYLTGGGSLFPDAAASFQQSLGLPVQTLDLAAGLPIAGLDTPAERLNAAGGVAIGTALKGLDIDAHRTDFRQDEFRYEKRFEQLQKTLMITCLVLLCLFGVVALSNHRRIQGLKKQREALQIKQTEIWDAAFQGEFPYPGLGRAKGDMFRQYDTLGKLMGEIKSQKPKVSALTMLYEFLANTQKFKDQYRVREIHLEQRDSRMILEVWEQAIAYDIRAEMNKSGVIRAEQPDVQIAKDRDREFTQAIYNIQLAQDKP